ncbi:MAG: TraR/DksA C4-type zinc finger protein [Candidatus Kerfeldbacteria bacterium]|nr:TraR/DksA C4-type zinc finger protein [Candidatus Kerfeldbacteria bacterium]
MLTDTAKNALKKRLETERDDLVRQLEEIGRRSPADRTDFETEFPDYGDKPDENATEVSDFQDNLSIERKLEEALGRVRRALKAIEKGTYGTCTKCGKPISSQRLAAMPSVTRCIEHSALP